MHRRWLSLPLLSSCVSAFYPYREPHEHEPNEKRFITLDLGADAATADGSGFVQLDMKKTPVKRNNQFPIINSAQPQIPNAVAINSDASDFTYISTMKFGSSAQELNMLIDSGSANTWVMGSSCASNACKIHNTFGSQDSSTLHVTTQSWSMVYGTGQVQGVVASDSVQLANYTVNLGFGLASTASDDFLNYPMDGILGLGRPKSDALGTPTIMQVLDQQGGLAENILGIHLQRSADGAKDGQLTFGGIDSSKYSGDLVYMSTVNDEDWEIAAEDAGVDGHGVGFSNKKAIIDTGTSYVLMPPADAAALHAKIPGSSLNGETYLVPCSSTSNVFFTFSGTQFTVSPKDYVGVPSGGACQSNIISHQAFGPDDWILGDVFLKNVYTVLDFDQNRVGFGTPLSSSGHSSSSSTISPSSSSSHQSSASSSVAPSTHATTLTTSATSATSAGKTTTSSVTSTGNSAVTTSSKPDDSSPFGQSGTSDAGNHPVRLATAILVAFLIGLLL